MSGKITHTHPTHGSLTEVDQLTTDFPNQTDFTNQTAFTQEFDSFMVNLRAAESTHALYQFPTLENGPATRI